MLIEQYVRLLERRACGGAVVLIWLGAAALGVISARPLLAALGTHVPPVPGSATERAQNALNTAFPALQTQDVLAIFWSSDGSALPPSAVSNLTASLADFSAPWSSVVASGPISAATLAAAGWASQAATMQSADRTTTYVRIGTRVGVNVAPMLRALKAALPGMKPAGGPWQLGLTGLGVMSLDESAAVESDVVRSDAATLPVSFAILAYVLRSSRLLILTLAALVAALAAAFALTLRLAEVAEVPSFAVSLIVATCVALSLDYSLFLLSALATAVERGGAEEGGEEACTAREGRPMAACLKEVLHSTGHTVLVSGITLAACYAVLALFPLPLLRWPGVAAAATVLFAVAANLTLVPALLLHAPTFWMRAFAKPVSDGGFLAQLWARRTPTADCGADAEAPAGAKESDTAVKGAAGLDVWRLITEQTQRWRCLVLCVITLALVVPFAPHLRNWQTSEAWESSMPRGAESLRLYRLLGEQFGQSAGPPSFLLGTARDGGSILRPQLFEATRGAALAAYAARPETEIASLAWSGGGLSARNASTSLASLQATLSLGCPAGLACPSGCLERACAARQAAQAWVSSDGQSTLVWLHPVVDTLNKGGYAWALSMRELAASLSASDAVMEWQFCGDKGTIIGDAVAYVYGQIPTLVGVNAAVVFIIVGLAFRSLVIPLRTVTSIGLATTAVFGAAAAVFETGVLDGAGSDLFTSKYGLAWLVPVLCLSLIVGLGLDYDIFLMGRIEQERAAGWDDESAILRGVQRSGPIISWAGCIMAVAFGGLLSSSLPLLNQLSFMVVFAVVIDTFLVRTFWVPAAHGLLGGAVWWPSRGRHPPPSRSRDEAPGCEDASQST